MEMMTKMIMILKMGSTASKSSKLGVGIGIGEKEVTLYQEKLEMDKPLLDIIR